MTGHETRPRRACRIAVITMSDTRSAKTDESGARIRSLAEAAGHAIIETRVLREDPAMLGSAVRALSERGTVEVIVVTGGTGVGRRDRTIEELAPLYDRKLDGFGELFRALSYAEVGPHAMLSRAELGIVGTVVVVALPGSPKAVTLAMEKLLLPTLGHLVELASEPP